MATLAFDSLVEPVSAEAACGPDLDAAGDADFLGFAATAEGMLPSSFFAFDPNAFDLDGSIAAGLGLVDRTKDIRLLVLLGKLALLKRNVAGFSACVAAAARLMTDHWEEINPRGEDGDFLMRMAPLYTLDDMAPVLLPLQYAPLVEAGRLGTLSFRAHLVASGEVKARDGEQMPDAGTIERILLEADLDALIAIRDALAALQGGLAGLRSVAVAMAGFEQAVRLERLPPLVDRMLTLLDDAVGRRDPGAALGAPVAGEAEPDAPDDADDTPASAAPAARPPGRINGQGEAAAALAAALGYFERFEPSSPAILLVRQASQLIGKNLFEVMQILVPGHAEAARIHVGGEPAFTVAVSRLAAASPPLDVAAALPPVETRHAAVGLLDQVAGYYRAAEPSSPIPLLIDRAKLLSSRDFAGLLKDILPEAALKTMKAGG